MTTRYFDIKNPDHEFDFDELMERNYKANAAPYTLHGVDIYDINDVAIIFDNTPEVTLAIMIGNNNSITKSISELERKLNIKLEERE